MKKTRSSRIFTAKRAVQRLLFLSQTHGLILYVSMLFVLLSTVSCMPAVVGTTLLSVGVMNQASKEGGLHGFINDTDLRIKINYRWMNTYEELMNYLNLSVQHGRVLLIGTVPNEDFKTKAVQSIQNIQGVKEIIDEIQVGSPESSDFLEDAWITRKINAALLISPVAGKNYGIMTHRRVVYVLGIAQDLEEKESLLRLIQNTQKVLEVRAHIQMKPPETEGTPSTDIPESITESAPQMPASNATTPTESDPDAISLH